MLMSKCARHSVPQSGWEGRLPRFVADSRRDTDAWLEIKAWTVLALSLLVKVRNIPPAVALADLASRMRLGFEQRFGAVRVLPIDRRDQRTEHVHAPPLPGRHGVCYARTRRAVPCCAG
jgi:hypothetical protein